MRAPPTWSAHCPQPPSPSGSLVDSHRIWKRSTRSRDSCAPESDHATPSHRRGRDVMPHLTALQQIAEQHGDNRAFGTEGFTASLRYVKSALDYAGYCTHAQMQCRCVGEHRAREPDGARVAVDQVGSSISMESSGEELAHSTLTVI